MNRILILIGFVFLAVSCDKVERPAKPENLLSTAQMSNIYYDIFVMNGAKGVNKKHLEEKGVNPYEFVFDKHNTDSLQFFSSNDYYAFDIETYNNLLLDVKLRLEKEKEEFNGLYKEEERLKDSIREVKRKKRDSLKRKPSNSLLKNKIKPINNKKDSEKVSIKRDSSAPSQKKSRLKEKN
ncbi:MAG: hypothetical protein BM564_04445 [Bacteroidetes bacterium MedPE-SWsnd-G2]|nr:MAG: hypothetical protein BM564_04445 [Bacteroidetes bacterium MedPE-SWsnd-G2]